MLLRLRARSRSIWRLPLDPPLRPGFHSRGRIGSGDRRRQAAPLETFVAACTDRVDCLKDADSCLTSSLEPLLEVAAYPPIHRRGLSASNITIDRPAPSVIWLLCPVSASGALVPTCGG